MIGNENTGVCRFCVEIAFVDNNETENGTADERNNIATGNCTCELSKQERDKKSKIENAKERIRQLFGEDAPDYGFDPIEEGSIIRLLDSAVYQIAERKIISVTIDINYKTKAKISSSAKGKINIERTEVSKYKLEE